MWDNVKKAMVDKGMALMQSENVTRILSSEKVGQVVEKAMTVPFKISAAVTAQKERFVTLLDLATQEDIDDLRRSMARIEDTVSALKSASDTRPRKNASTKK